MRVRREVGVSGADSKSGSFLRTLRRLALACAPAGLLGLYAQVPILAVVPYFALVPWIVLYGDDREPKVPIWYHVIGAYLTWLALYPQVARFAWYAPLIMGMVLFLVWPAFAPLFRTIHHRFHLPRTLTFPIVWVTVEWLRSTFTLSSFDLFALGYSQGRFPVLIQIADITGVYGVSFLVASANGLIADVIFRMRDARSVRWSAWLTKRIAVAATVVSALFGATIVYGVIRLSGIELEPGPRLALLQPNLPHTGRNVIGVHLGQVLLTERLVPAGGADMIVWPENAILDDIERPGIYLDDLAWLGNRKQSCLLVGAAGKSNRRPGYQTNSAFLLGPDARIIGRYDKLVLFPWSEYVPFDEFLSRTWPWLQRTQRGLVRMAWGSLSNGEPGEKLVLLRLPWKGSEIPFGAVICVENCYPPLPAEASRRGARFFVNITSEGEIGGVMQEQLLRVCIMRAVENRIAYVRVGNTGISAVIDPLGRRTALLRGERGGTISDVGVLIERVPLSAGNPTIYARSRDAFALACVLGTLFLILWRPRRKLVAAAVIGLAAAFAAGCGAPQPGRDVAGARQALERGQRLQESRRPRLALPHLVAACADEATCRQALPLLGDVYKALEKPEEAVDLFFELARMHPAIALEAKSYRALFLDRSLRWVEAEKEYKQILTEAPSARVWGLLGNLYMRYARFDEAAEAYRRGCDLTPGDAQARYLYARALMSTGTYDAARRELDAALAANPSHAAAWAMLGHVEAVQGDPAARANLMKAAQLDPKNRESRFWLARLAMRAGYLSEAEQWMREIYRIESGLGRGRGEP
jgi:apolipoprotein N-acyltransferase